MEEKKLGGLKIIISFKLRLSVGTEEYIYNDESRALIKNKAV
jgi:hypothetical protein